MIKPVEPSKFTNALLLRDYALGSADYMSVLNVRLRRSKKQ